MVYESSFYFIMKSTPSPDGPQPASTYNGCACVVKILVINGGSSSLKCWFSDLPDGPLPIAAPQPHWSARADWSEHSGIAEVQIKRSDGATIERQLHVDAPVGVLEPILDLLWKGEAKVLGGPSDIQAVGHRIVHGGPKFRESTLLTADVRNAIAEQVEFAPAHNRFELESIQTIDHVLGTAVPQIACFDTGFHSTLEPAAYVYPGPYSWVEQGIRRYGFHGISHQYASARASEMLGGDPQTLRLIVCHLGNGASLAAVRGGKSVDTTMGFTPIEGLMMGTRCGSIDPGIFVFLIRNRGYTADQLDRILNRESGLYGVSGVSADMREVLHAMEDHNERAQLAFDVYAHRLIREVGAMLAVLGGLDALIFTGGVGENTWQLREIVCEQFGFLGMKVDAVKNREPKLDADVADDSSTVRVLVIRAEEEWEIARECHRLLAVTKTAS
jgi:acetate kinase